MEPCEIILKMALEEELQGITDYFLKAQPVLKIFNTIFTS